jgi:hypothetical protein
VLLAAIATWVWWLLLAVGALGIVRTVVGFARREHPLTGTGPLIRAHPRGFLVACSVVIAVAVVWLIIQAAH